MNKVTNQMLEESKRLKQSYSVFKKNHQKIPKSNTPQVKTASLECITLITAPRVGKRLGPYQGTIDKGIHLQVTRPPTKNKPRLEDLNLGAERKVMKKWK